MDHSHLEEEELQNALRASAEEERQNILLASEDDELQRALRASICDPSSQNVKRQTSDEFAMELERAINESKQQQPKSVSYSEKGHFLEEWMAAAGAPRSGFQRRFVGLPEKIGGLIVGPKFVYANQIEDTAGGCCSIRFLNGRQSVRNGSCLIIEANNELSITTAENLLMRRVEECLLVHRPDPKQQRSKEVSAVAYKTSGGVSLTSIGTGALLDHPLGPERRRHVFIDNSNIFIGAQYYQAEGGRRSSPDYSTRLHVRNLASLIIGNPTETGGSKLVVGSKPPAGGKIWQEWQNAGFRVRVCSRDVNSGHEDLIDECIHAQVYLAVAESMGQPAGTNTLVLLTGDGNDNNGYSNFVSLAKHAVQAGWRVEIWAWKSGYSSKLLNLIGDYSDNRVLIFFLDEYADKILTRSKINISQGGSSKNSGGHGAAGGGKSTISNIMTGLATGGKSVKLSQQQRQQQHVFTAPATAADVIDLTAEGDDDDEQNDDCVICMENPYSHVFVPCGHLCCCEMCAILFKECPMCKTAITATVKVHQA